MSFTNTQINKYLNDKTFIMDHDLSNINAYGEDREEALENLHIALDYMIKELIALQSNLDNNIVEIERE